jgi:hypothetical protein
MRWTTALIAGVSALTGFGAGSPMVSATSGAVDASGTAVIYTLPQPNGHPRVWRWSSGGRPAQVPAPGAFTAQPAW